MKKTLVLFSVLALVVCTGLFAQQNTYKIGERGPGGGYVISTEKGKGLECFGAMGPYNWYYALEYVDNMNKNAGETGKKDWRLPTGDELLLIYKTVKSNNMTILAFDRGYWSSEDSKNVAGAKWYVNFKNGYGGSKDPNTSTGIYVFPVRSFNP